MPSILQGAGGAGRGAAALFRLSGSFCAGVPADQETLSWGFFFCEPLRRPLLREARVNQ
jgi:hypothetical protein